MGGNLGKPKINDNILLNSNGSIDDFDYSQSFATAYCVDSQKDEDLLVSLGSAVVKDAATVMNALCKKKSIVPDNIKTLQGELCTFEKMKSSLQEQAVKVTGNGVFFVFYAGHLTRVEGQPGLVPSDYDGTTETHVTGRVLIQWLKTIDYKAKHTIFILDCCYAGSIAQDLVDVRSTIRGLHVLAACGARETLNVFEVLENSIFSFFLGRAIDIEEFKAGQFPIAKVYNTLCDPCSALSSLFIAWDTLPDPATITPELLSERDLVVKRGDVTHHLEYVGEHPRKLDKECIKWIKKSDKNIRRLWRVIDRRVLNTILCCMMYSVAVMEVHYETKRVGTDLRNHRNLCVTAYGKVLKAINSIYPPLHFDKKECAEGLSYYKDAIKKMIDIQPIESMISMLLKA